MSLRLRRADHSDIDLLFQWANDAAVRSNAFHTEMIPYGEHVRWFEKMMADSSVYQYILCEDETPLGQIRLNVEQGEAFIDYSVSPSQRKKGYGSTMLRMMQEQLSDDKISCVTKIIGQVKHGNDASARVFEKCGFHRKEMPEYIQYEKEVTVQLKIIIATIKSWNIERAKALQKKYEGIHDIVIYTSRDEFTADNVCDFHPDYIFLPHWSYIMPKEITDRWECVVFHMTDLPYGRGGSPLQNLIVRGHKETKISALRMTEKLDGGPIYMKHMLSLEGSAQEIYVRCSDIIFQEMIPMFLERDKKKITPVPQEGEPVVFKRRKPEEGRITPDMKMEQIYDYIRMLDAEGYPRAFIEFGDYRLEFEQANVSDDGKELSARVIFRREPDQPDM